MQIGQVHVVVVVPHASLRASLVAWLRANKRVRLVRAVASVADLGTHHIDCDLVVASALDGPRGLRAIAKRFGKQAGLVALSLGLARLPAGWEPVRPGAAYREVLDHAVPHPERSIANTSTVLRCVSERAICRSSSRSPRSCRPRSGCGRAAAT